jgi:ribosomal-protein-alanine N-acetyltransferase
MMRLPKATFDCKLLFVYGSLLRGFELHHHLVRLGAKCCGKGRVAGQLFDLGRYPGARPSTLKGKWVCGEIYRLRRPQHDLRVLDAVEGFDPSALERGEFTRAMTMVTLEGGKSRRAWMYWLNRPLPRTRRIASGDYLQWRKQSKPERPTLAFPARLPKPADTDRLRFEVWDVQDWIPFSCLATDPQVMKYISDGVLPEDRIREFVARQMAGYQERGFCLWKLVEKETGLLAGICGLQPLAETADVEIGWSLRPNLWGRGLATEAARRALTFGFEVSKLDRIVAVSQPANRASIRIMEKIGMRYEREVIHNGFRVVLYAITAAEYRSRPLEGDAHA